MRGSYPKRSVEIRTHSFPCPPLSQPPPRTDAATLAEASPALPPAKSLQPWSPRGRNPSLPHSEQWPPNTDEAESLSKQLLSDSVRPKRAPGVTEFSHLPQEVSKSAVLPREEVPPASSTAPSGHSGTTPGKTFWAVAPRTSSSQAASEPPRQAGPRGPPQARGQRGARGPAAAQSWVQEALGLTGRYLPPIHRSPGLHARKTGTTPTSPHPINGNQATRRELSGKVPAFQSKCSTGDPGWLSRLSVRS